MSFFQIWRVNTLHNVLWVQGPAVPGGVGSYVYIYDSILPHRKPTSKRHPPFPTFFQDEQDIEEELYDNELHSFNLPSIQFAEK